MNDNLNALPLGTELNHYVIEAVLGSGGFGIVYKAHHAHLDEQVVIKEFLPVELAGRHGNTVAPHGTSKQEVYSECLRRFMEEGRTLVKLRHPNVVRCRDLFTANGTAYLVMDFEDGLPLDELVRSLEVQGSRYTEQQLLHFLLPLADGLAYIHSQGVLHRDIKPANVFIRRSDGSPVIIDFGAAKQNFALASQSQAPFTEFYAPLEQIEGGGEAKPTVDIHAFGALMYRLATGQMGPKAEARAMALVYGKPDPLQPAALLAQGQYSQAFLTTIDQCLAFRADQRPQTMRELVQRLAQQESQPQTAQSQPQVMLSALDDLIALAGADSVINDTEMTMLLNKASSLGIGKDKAQQYIVQLAVSRGWQIGQHSIRQTPADVVEASVAPADDISADLLQRSGVDAQAFRDKLYGNTNPKKASKWRWVVVLVPLIAVAIWQYDLYLTEVKIEQARLAELRVQEEADTRAFKVALKEDTQIAYEVYLNVYPNGLYRDEAQQQIKILADKKAEADKQLKLEAEKIAKAKKEAERKALKALELAGEMLTINGGSFNMGCSANGNECKTNEQPNHRVKVASFRLAKYELTRDRFALFVNATGYKTDAEKNSNEKQGCYGISVGGSSEWGWVPGLNWRNANLYDEPQTGRHPVVCVSETDVQAYLKWLNAQTGMAFRLPSEAEWEYAARAGADSEYFFGNDISKACAAGNVADETPLKNTNVWTNKVSCKDQYSFTAPVGQFQSNKYGFYDMVGNVMELTDDCYNSSFDNAPSNGKAWRSGNCNVRVIRGGAFNYAAEYLRSAKRNTVNKSERKIDIGFRLAHSIEG
ncbi:MAG: SUMF1/EgtB/PvdO family nonheme iron enzyme [Gammaproteobacteria bacterium]|nr:SUMF1/EgtB/PvdO family nonheme iron enzyme [Gammaproteobacteria bacterium]